MNENPGLRELSQSRAALIAGIVLSANVIIAMPTFFVLLPGIIGSGNAAEVLSNIIASEQRFRLGILFLVLNFIADVFVFWGLYYFLKPVSKSISFLTLLFGLMHVVIGLLSVSNLTALLHMANRIVFDTSLSPSFFYSQAATMIDAFHWAWQAGFVIFGLHLLLRGCLFFWAGYMKKLLGIALILAGAAYLFDGFAQIIVFGYNTTYVATYLGTLEILLPVWLLIKGRRKIYDLFILIPSREYQANSKCHGANHQCPNN